MIVKEFINILIPVLYIAIIARVILSWFPMGGANNPLIAIVYHITEPILLPLRRVIPNLGFLDLTPMIALILLGIIQGVVNRNF